MSTHSDMIDGVTAALPSPVPGVPSAGVRSAGVRSASVSSPAVATRGVRARPMAANERRAAIIAATLPLVLEHGATVSTRQIADAAGVAEGTIFRAFPDKDSLIAATIAAALDPAPLLAELAEVDEALALRPRMVVITEILQRRMLAVAKLMMAVGMKGPPLPDGPRREMNAVINAAIARLLRTDRDRFRHRPTEVARLWRLLMFTASHPAITDGNVLAPKQIVSLLLDGVLKQHECSSLTNREVSSAD